MPEKLGVFPLEKIKSQLMDKQGMSRTVKRLAHEILERNEGSDPLVFVGIRNRGDILAKRLQKLIQTIEGREVPLGILDITLYRDDFERLHPSPVVQETDIAFDITDKIVILVDDVLYTGRTVRAALDALMDFGRPACIQLAVLVDRGHRELPIKADYVGMVISTAPQEQVEVHLEEIDGEDGVYLVRPQRG